MATASEPLGDSAYSGELGAAGEAEGDGAGDDGAQPGYRAEAKATECSSYLLKSSDPAALVVGV